MQVRHFLPAICASVDYTSESAIPLLLGHLVGYDERVSKQLLMLRRDCSKTGDALSGHQENVHRRLRRNVATSEALAVLVDVVGRHLTDDDLVEDGRLRSCPSVGSRASLCLHRWGSS
ncbi:uncharacterized protein METZ01_LOCUS462165, partial [marine metagenome]